MARAKRTRKFATMKRMISASDPRLKAGIDKMQKYPNCAGDRTENV